MCRHGRTELYIDGKINLINKAYGHYNRQHVSLLEQFNIFNNGCEISSKV